MRRSHRRNVGKLLLTAALAWVATPGGADPDRLLTLRATAVDLGAVTPSGTRPASVGLLELGIERWTTDEEDAKIAAILAEKGADSLRDALQDLPRAGFIRTPTSLGWDVRYARQIELPDGGRRIVFATDRPMSFRELWRRPQSVDYQFLAGEIRLGPDGQGKGTLVPAARIDYNRATRTIEVEDYASQPVRLTEVHAEG
jgi:hypothetical protein